MMCQSKALGLRHPMPPCLEDNEMIRGLRWSFSWQEHETNTWFNCNSLQIIHVTYIYTYICIYVYTYTYTYNLETGIIHEAQAEITSNWDTMSARGKPLWVWPHDITTCGGSDFGIGPAGRHKPVLGIVYTLEKMVITWDGWCNSGVKTLLYISIVSFAFIITIIIAFD